MNEFQIFRDPWLWLLAWLATIVTVTTGLMAEEFKEPEPVKAPAEHAMLTNTLGGWYFAPKPLKDAYDATVGRLEMLQTNLDQGRVPMAEAKAELAELKARLDSLRRDIEANKVLVEGAKVHEQTETIEFELGAEQRLAITANQVRVLGWNRPKVRCELKKTVLSNDDKPVEPHLSAIKTVHLRGRAEFAGKTPAEVEAEEQKYLAGDGAKLTEEQRVGRKKFVDSIQQARAFYRDYQAKEIDQITIDGLGYQENESITLYVKSERGDGQMGSVRRRYAVLTVYVPACNGVCIRGAMRGLSVENLSAPLLINDEDSTDSDHRASFTIEGLRGDLVARNMPLQKITEIEGRAEIIATTEFEHGGGGGTMHRDDMRHMHPPHPLPVRIQSVRDGVKAWYGRANLDLADIGGMIDIRNDFGNTRLTATEAFPAGAHRVVTESGRIDVELSQAALGSISLAAVTNHGGIKTNLTREVFEDFHLRSFDNDEGIPRSWSGFRTKAPNEDRFAVFGLSGRFRSVLNNTDRAPGLDIVSRGGTTVVTTAK